MSFSIKRGAAFALAVACCLAMAAFSQEFRGSITGRVLDAGGAAVANARVQVTNTATNSSSNTTTNENGEFSVFYLIPGPYAVSVEAGGFKKATRSNIEVRVGDKLQLDLKLEVGALTESVNVTAETAVLEVNSASAGQVIDQRRIAELPLSDGNPFVLSRLSPGIAYTGDLRFSRPFDNAGTSSIVADGAPGRNEFTLDGVPNMASGGGVGRVAFVPPADAVQEFKVETAAYDGQTAHTAGATVNVTLKSGTNQLHGTIYEFVRNDVLSANTFFLNRTNLAANPSRDRDQDGKADRDPLRYNRYGFTVGGPVFLPKKVFGPASADLRNRSFFFFAFEGLKDVFPEPGLFTVPTAKQRSGDFSDLLPSIVIYDPATARADGSRVRRTPFAGNVIPANRISAIARNYLSFYPLPNQPGDAQGRNNYISGNPRTDDFHSESFRVDQTLTEKQRFFIRYTHNNRKEARGNWTGVVNGIRPTGNFLFRINDGFTFDHVYNFSPSVVLNSRVGFSRFNEPNIRQHQDLFDPRSLGFPTSTTALFGPELYLPRFEIGGFSVLGDSVGGGSTHNIYSLQTTLTKIAGRHSFRVGYDGRSYRENSFGAGQAAGRYDFGSNFTRGPLDNSAAAPIGQELASFLLGQPTGGLIDRNAARSNQTLYHGFFFHDDWKLNDKLTFNLGLRYEYEGATDERYNRNIRTFDATVASPIEAAAKAAYAASPIPEVAASAFQVKGGLLFADANNRSFWDADRNNYQPRLGLAYKLNEKTVIRGGWGLYTVPFVIAGVNQSGFSLSTPIVASTNNGLTFLSDLANPFPTGVLVPAGASLGLSALLGQGVSFLPRDVNNTQAQRWSFGGQRELPGNWLLELQYVGNRGYDGVVSVPLNAIPRQYLSTSPVRDQTVINFLTTNVANPFRNLIPGTGLNGATVNRQQLLRPFPQYTGVTGIRNDGTSSYHSAQVRAEKRFSKGYTALVSYTWSKFLEAGSLLNEVDTNFERRLSDADTPHRLVVSGIWEIPFGRGRKWGAGWGRALDAVAGGWQVQGIGQLQAGRPLTIGNVYVNGDISKLSTDIQSRNVDGLVFDISRFYFTDATDQTNGVVDPAKQRNDSRIQLANNIRTLPSRMAQFRGDALNLWDLSVSKNFSFTEKIRLQLRGEFLNAFNKVIFNNPTVDPRNTNFGKVTGQANLPRDVQIGLKLIF
ncbi:MAG: carboxypeptidase regulatory-like domain-containing protein [Blastocatellia bacterium]|nr:carboxypeptidase regulatory-like domain-containing protein [Blastocatellia bacterium]